MVPFALGLFLLLPGMWADISPYSLQTCLQTLTYDWSQVHDLMRTLVGIGMFCLRSSLRLYCKQILHKALLGISWDARIIIPKIAGTHCSSSANRFYLGYKYLAPVEKLCHLSEDVMCEVIGSLSRFPPFGVWL